MRNLLSDFVFQLSHSYSFFFHFFLLWPKPFFPLWFLVDACNSHASLQNKQRHQHWMWVSVDVYMVPKPKNMVMTIIIRLINKFLELCALVAVVVAWLSARDTSFGRTCVLLDWFNNNNTIAPCPMFNGQMFLPCVCARASAHVYCFLCLSFVWSRKKRGKKCDALSYHANNMPMLLLSTLVLLLFFLLLLFAFVVENMRSFIHNRWRWIRW